VRVCRCIVLTWFTTQYFTWHFNRLGTQLDTLHGFRRQHLDSFSLPPAIIFSFSIRIDTPRQYSSPSFVDAALSTDASLPINSSCQSIPLLVSTLMRLRVDALLFASPANILLSFLPPTNATSLLYCRLVLGIVLASILVACSSCRSRYRYTFVMVFLYWLVAVDIQEGFSFSVGPGTKRALYRFCDLHFFCDNAVAPSSPTRLVAALLQLLALLPL